MTEKKFLIVGLGNPGREYKNQRHNAGFIWLDFWQENFNFPSFVFKKKFSAEISEQVVKDFPVPYLLENFFRQKKISGKIILAKPQTFMNNSGLAVKLLQDFYKINPKNILVVHDELDLPLGALKLSLSSSPGHNGVKSIVSALKTPDFWRLKIGIEKTGGRRQRKTSGANFVLSDFGDEEKKKLPFLEPVF